MRDVSLTFRGVKLSFRLPTLAELTTFLETWSTPRASAGHRALLRSCAADRDALRDVLERAPAGHVVLGNALLDACGLTATVTELEEGEIADEAMARAFVEAQRREEGSKLGLHAIVSDVGPVRLRVITRDPTEREVDSHAANERDAAACAKLVRSLTVWGDLGAAEDAPGLFVVLANYAMQAAGLGEQVLVGEA